MKVKRFNIQLKLKNYDPYINQKQLEIFLTEAKDLFKENYRNKKIIHMLIKNILLMEKYSSIKLII